MFSSWCHSHSEAFSTLSTLSADSKQPSKLEWLKASPPQTSSGPSRIVMLPGQSATEVWTCRKQNQFFWPSLYSQARNLTLVCLWSCYFGFKQRQDRIKGQQVVNVSKDFHSLTSSWSRASWVRATGPAFVILKMFHLSSKKPLQF